MFGTIRRHQQWLWVVIITIIITSFVIFFSPDVFRGGRGALEFGSINGRKLTKEDFLSARKEEYMGFYLSQRRWPTGDEADRSMDQRVRQRIFLVEKLREFNIEVNDSALASHMAVVFRDAKGTFSNQVYDDFVKTKLPQAGLTEDDMFRYFRHQVGLQQLIATVGLSGRLASPRAGEASYVAENQQMAGAVAFLSVSNYVGTGPVDTNRLQAFYQSRSTNFYSSPKKVQVSYVAFAATNYFAEAEKRMAGITNLNMEIQQIYARGSTNLYKDMTEDAAKALIRKGVVQQFAVEVARSNAVIFANQVYASTNNPGLAELAAMAKKAGLALQDSELLTERGEANNLPPGDGDRLITAAFKLNSAEPLGQLFLTTNAVYMTALKNVVPPQVQKLDEVRSRVVDDLRQVEALEKMREAGAALQKKLTEGLPARSFKAICDEAGVKSVELPLFSADTPHIPGLDDRVSISTLSSAAARLSAGKVGNYIPIRDGGMIVYVSERKPPADTAMKLDHTMTVLREVRESAAFEEWFSKGYEKSGLAPQQPQQPAATIQ